MRGVPTDETMASSYWRKKTPPPTDPDPDRDRCGLLWWSPVVPNTGTHALEVADLVDRLLLSHGFEPQMSISFATERTLVCVITISYDRDVPGEDERAMACFRDLTTELLARGYPPYRLSVARMDAGGSESYGTLIETLKKAMDPAGILAPGRYAPPRA